MRGKDLGIVIETLQIVVDVANLDTRNSIECKTR